MTREEIFRRMGVEVPAEPAKVQPKTEPAPSVNLASLTELLTSGELHALHRRAGEFYAELCLKKPGASMLLDDAAEALGIAPDRAERIVHALARLVGLRAPTKQPETLAAATVSEAIMIPLFEEN